MNESISNEDRFRLEHYLKKMYGTSTNMSFEEYLSKFPLSNKASKESSTISKEDRIQNTKNAKIKLNNIKKIIHENNKNNISKS
jgi:hypothetical protein